MTPPVAVGGALSASSRPFSCAPFAAFFAILPPWNVAAQLCYGDRHGPNRWAERIHPHTRCRLWMRKYTVSSIKCVKCQKRCTSDRTFLRARMRARSHGARRSIRVSRTRSRADRRRSTSMIAMRSRSAAIDATIDRDEKSLRCAEGSSIRRRMRTRLTGEPRKRHTEPSARKGRHRCTVQRLIAPRRCRFTDQRVRDDCGRSRASARSAVAPGLRGDACTRLALSSIAIARSRRLCAPEARGFEIRRRYDAWRRVPALRTSARSNCASAAASVSGPAARGRSRYRATGSSRVDRERLLERGVGGVEVALLERAPPFERQPVRLGACGGPASRVRPARACVADVAAYRRRAPPASA